ncbi:MAG: RlmE family RNA methyltransferase [Cytophagaceae bacterium]|nr:MAG: RlmE family RNA methyltransferase [Cytophagaceae bacterium]
MPYNPRDYYYQQAKKENYAARSVFKLQEIEKRFRIFFPGMIVLDLGAAPGSWSQYAAEKIGKNGKVLGIDIQAIKLTIRNACFITADIRALDLAQTMAENSFRPPFHLVMSDMAPKTTGNKLQDQMRSLELCEIALEASDRFLCKNGHFICKMFHSEEFESFRQKCRDRFKKVELIRPKSTRKESKEIFFVCTGHLHEPREGGKKSADSAAPTEDSSVVVTATSDVTS